MSLFEASAGSVFAARARLTTTFQALDVASKGIAVTIPMIRLVNLTGSPVAVDIEIDDSTDSWALLKAGVVPANGALEVCDSLLGFNETLKAKAGSNDAIDIHVIAGVNR